MENITPQGIMFATLVITLWFLPLYKILGDDGSFTTKVILFFVGVELIYKPDFQNNLIQVISKNQLEMTIELAHSDTNQLLIIPYSNLTIEKSIKASAKF